MESLGYKVIRITHKEFQAFTRVNEIEKLLGLRQLEANCRRFDFDYPLQNLQMSESIISYNIFCAMQE